MSRVLAFCAFRLGGSAASLEWVGFGKGGPVVAALRRSSREMVPGSGPTSRAISRTLLPWVLSNAISSRSGNGRYLPDGGFESDGPKSPHGPTDTGPWKAPSTGVEM